uniref:C2 domain-containing protein n=1 Tax=Romanomermis culicivorax TaxID=13658 RepID=A0A915I7M1_ROMCU
MEAFMLHGMLSGHGGAKKRHGGGIGSSGHHNVHRHSLKKLQDVTVCMQLMDYDRFSHDDPIGEVLLPLKDVKFEKRPVYWKNLQEPTVRHKEVRGELMLSICYTPEYNRLTVVVVKAKDLPSKDISGTVDPYVKLWLVHQGNKWEKRKTTVKNQNLSPVFNETFAFTVTKDRLQDTQLVASVMDRDIIGNNDEIGHIILGKRGSDTGHKHWKEVCDKPTQPMTMWHKLSPRW